DGCSTWPCTGRDCAKTLTVCRYHETCMGGTGMSAAEDGLAFCPDPEQAKKLQPQCSDRPPACIAPDLRSQQVGYCRPGDVGGAPCGACGCEEAPDHAACEKKVADCLKNNRSLVSRDCVFVYSDAENLRVGAVCDGRAVELSPESWLP